MSNKLEEMKKRLLLSKPPTSLADQKIQHPYKSTQIKEKELPKSIEAQNIPFQLPERIKDKNIDNIEHKNSSSSSKEAKISDNQQLHALNKQILDGKEQESIEACVQEELLNAELKRVQQPLMKKNEDHPCNLELVDRNPFFSCSVDEQVKGSLNNLNAENDKANLLIQMDSKQQKKQQKIILKQLQLIKQSIKNLKSSIKGLQKLQSMIASAPKIRTKVKFLLQQMNQALIIDVRK